MTVRPRKTAWCALIGLVGVIAARASLAQPQNALVEPPRLDDGPGVPRLAARVAEREPMLEEVVVVGESEWRLPDLGSDWRREQEEALESRNQRIEVSFLPLYDPENADPYANLFPPDSELHRVGFIELFRIRFGERSRD